MKHYEVGKFNMRANNVFESTENVVGRICIVVSRLPLKLT